MTTTESVWDYPRPPRVEPDARVVRVELDGSMVAETTRALRVLETASPPTFYVPMADVVDGALVPVDGRSICEWKGVAQYYDLVADGSRSAKAAWSYPQLPHRYAELADHVAFYPGKVACYVGDERVRPQEGNFYGGWVTDEIVGPWKGAPGTAGW